METQKTRLHMANWKKVTIGISVFALSAISLPKMIEAIRKDGAMGTPAAITLKQEKETRDSVLLERLHSPDPETRMDALGALYDPLKKMLSGKRMLTALPGVLKNLKHDDPGVRLEAVLALRTIAEDNPKGAEHSIAIVGLRGCAKGDADPHVRDAAADGLRSLTANGQEQAGAFY